MIFIVEPDGGEQSASIFDLDDVGEAMVILDDEIRDALMNKIAHRFARVGRMRVICSDNTASGVEIIERVRPRLAILDAAFSGNQSAGIELVRKLIERSPDVPTKICPFTQNSGVRIEAEISTDSRVEVLRTQKKSGDPEVFVRWALSHIFKDGREVTEFYVVGVDRSTNYVELLVPAWSVHETIRMQVKDEAFGISSKLFWATLSRDAELRTLVLSGRADLSALSGDELYPWVYEIVGELPDDKDAEDFLKADGWAMPSWMSWDK